MKRLLLGICLTALTYAQTDSWLTFHGDYSGQRHTKLAEITPDNVANLQQVWRFETHQNQQIKASPIVADGVLYITTPDNIWAIDARTAAELWHYQNPPNNAFHIGHRGAAIYKDTVYLTTPDCHLVALNAKTGKVKWDVVLADSNKGYWATNAPLVVRNHVLVGLSGDFDNLPGQLKSIDADTGAIQWTFYSTPPPGSKDSTSGGATGGQMWTTGTYDPDLNLVYVGTANPTPVLNGYVRPGDNPWTCAIVALNPDTGKLIWGFQVSPHDTHDWDANEVPVLVDANFNGEPRKLVMQASRNGYFFVLDRTNGKSLLTTPFATVNWAKGIDAQGRPIPNPAKFPSKSGVLVAPNENGATNFRPPSFDRETGLFIVSAQDGYGIYFFKPEHGAYGWAGADYGIAGRAFLRAIDYQTGKIVWNHPIGDGAGTAGVLTTETGVTFSGDVSGNVLALRTSDGSTLWRQELGEPGNAKIGNGPITYQLDGRQYLVVGGGSSLYAFALPGAAAQIRTPTRVMLLDGESGGPYHKWQSTTPVLRKELEETGLFQVDVVTAPPAGGDFAAFKPDFSKYAVVVWNYDAPDERWPAALKASFENYVRGGGGFVSVHASDNAFPGWPAFNEMIGVGGWRGRSEKDGPFWFYKDGKLVSDPAPGAAGSHGQRTPFQIVVRQDHPITNGLPKVWMHQGDELYARLRGPGKNMSVLATAYSDPANSGTGRDEPMLMTQLRQRACVPYHAGARYQRAELGRFRGDLPARNGMGRNRQGDAEGSLRFSYRRLGQLSDGPRRHGPRLQARAESSGCDPRAIAAGHRITTRAPSRNHLLRVRDDGLYSVQASPEDRSLIAVGVFLKAAYEVLNITRKPLTAPEIVEAAKARGLLKTSGKTPEQTMKSKLATNILTSGDRSPFMRAAKGRFALREWKGAYPEHIADRYQKALFDEDIVVFPATSLRRYVPVDGLYHGNFDKNELYNECRPMRRREAEEDFSVIQLVSVFVIRYGDQYLTYKRTKRLPESRLHGVYSLGFGGHLNPSDLLPLLNIFDPTVGLPLLERELREEVKFESLGSTDISYRGLIYDTSREVSRQHLGLVYYVLASSPAFEIGERGFLMNPKYETIEEINRRRDDFENWSLVLIDEEIRCNQELLIQRHAG